MTTASELADELEKFADALNKRLNIPSADITHQVSKLSGAVITYLPLILSSLRKIEVMEGAADEALHQLEHVMGLVRPGVESYQHNIALAIGSLKAAHQALAGES